MNIRLFVVKDWNCVSLIIADEREVSTVEVINSDARSHIDCFE